MAEARILTLTLDRQEHIMAIIIEGLTGIRRPQGTSPHDLLNAMSLMHPGFVVRANHVMLEIIQYLDEIGTLENDPDFGKWTP